MDYIVSYGPIFFPNWRKVLGQLRLLSHKGECHFLFVHPQGRVTAQSYAGAQNVCARVCYKGEILQILSEFL